MTQTNTFAGKLGVAFVAIAMALMMVAPAQAETAEELQAKIDALMATIASLQATTAAPAASANAYVFTRSLTIGSQGADVTALQTYLIGAGHAIPAGATGYFGGQTQSAVAAWQTANGVMPAAGYFGPVSQAKYTALMAAVTPTPDDSDDDSTDDDDSSSTDLSGEASLSTTDLQDGDDTDIEEGQEAAQVAELELEFADGDAMVSRIDVSLVDTGTEEDPWDTFEEVSLWVDGDEVATIDVTDEDNWLDEDAGTLRFSGLDFVAMEDETVTVVIAVTVQSSVDNMPATWNVDALNVRYTDADDVTSTDTITETAVDFVISEGGSDDEITVKTSSEDPDATTIEVDDTDKTDFTTVFAFDLDTDDSVNDIELTTVPVTIVVANDTFGDIVNDLQLVIDGETYDDWSYTTGAAGSTTVVVAFDIDGDHTIDAGDRVTAELQVEFKALAVEGSTIAGSITGTNADNIVADGADDLDNTSPDQLTGAATGDTHTLRTTGAILEMTSSTETLKVNTDTTTADDEGVFTLKFDVTAFEQDVFVAKTAARGAATSTSGVNFTVENSAGSVVTTGTTTQSLTSTATVDGSYFKVNEGETKSFTLTVNFDPATSGYHQVQLYGINFASTAAAATTHQTAVPTEDYETEQLSI